MTLPNDDLIQYLQSRFILAHRNIEKDRHVGMSHGYKKDQSAVGTTNGAGPRNVQFLVLAPDETVVLALPGFWHAQDLKTELRLGLQLHQLYLDEDRTDEQKQRMFEQLHRAHLRRNLAGAERRGDWQNFDRWHEIQRVKTEPRDTFTKAADGTLELKTVPRVIHDRLIACGFQKLDDFDVESFVDYGRPFYDNNHHDKGKAFRHAKRENRKREAEQEKARAEAQRKAKRAARRKKRSG